MRALVAALIMLAALACTPIDNARAHRHVAIAGPSASGSLCADLYVEGTIGHASPGVIECLSDSQRLAWAGVGVTTDKEFQQTVGHWSGMYRETFVGKDNGELLYDLRGPSGRRMIFWVHLDPSGRIDGSSFDRLDR